MWSDFPATKWYHELILSKNWDTRSCRGADDMFDVVDTACLELLKCIDHLLIFSGIFQGKGKKIVCNPKYTCCILTLWGRFVYRAAPTFVWSRHKLKAAIFESTIFKCNPETNKLERVCVQECGILMRCHWKQTNNTCDRLVKTLILLRFAIKERLFCQEPQELLRYNCACGFISKTVIKYHQLTIKSYKH